MWKQQQRRFYGNNNRSNANQGRRIKTVPTSLLLDVIERSKKNKENIEAPMPIIAELHTFSEYALHPVIKNNIRAKGFTAPTPIQRQTIPAVLEGRDVIGMANTGTGKTAAFLIPLIHAMTQDHAQRVLVITPTRELAYQIQKEAWEFSRGLSIRSALVTGGASEMRQIQDIKRDPHIVISTPGRLKDFIQTKRISLSRFTTIVLDEADQMVDFGFINDIKYFMPLLPKKRQSLFFSATISSKVEEIMSQFVHNPIKISVAKQNIAATIRQDVIRIQPQKTKIDTLYELLQDSEFEKVLVFGRTKHGVQKVSDMLSKRGVRAGAIHGNKRQNQRMFVLNQFARNQIQVLLATDVASRGLDIPNVSHVINYDLPETIEDYTHRIGRTGRANKQGIALTFID